MGYEEKAKYKKFCESESVPIFSQPWWLDAVCGPNNWDVLLFEKGGTLWASMPYYIKKKFGFTIIGMPLLTQTLGPYIKYPAGQKYEAKLSWEQEVMEYFIDKLPSFSVFSVNFHKSITNWLPFYWSGFHQTTRYSYVIPKGMSFDEVLKNCSNDTKRRLLRLNELGIKPYESFDVGNLYRLASLTFKRKTMEIPYSYDFFYNLARACMQNDACKIYFVDDTDGNKVAGGLFVYDKNTVYYLVGGIDPEKKNLGAMNLVMFEGIKFALETGREFDFEGSMVKEIEKYFRSFGAIQVPYFRVYKYKTLVIRLYMCLKEK
jgi:hypothetical protein